MSKLFLKHVHVLGSKIDINKYLRLNESNPMSLLKKKKRFYEYRFISKHLLPSINHYLYMIFVKSNLIDFFIDYTDVAVSNSSRKCAKIKGSKYVLTWHTIYTNFTIDLESA